MNKPQSTVAAIRSAHQFGLGSLMLIVLWLATGLGLMRATMLLGILYTLASLPALARTWTCVARHKKCGQAMDNWALTRTFLRSAEMVGLLAVTSAAVCLGACMAICFWGLVVVTRLSRIAAGLFASLARPMHRLLGRAGIVTTRLVAATGRSLKRPRTIILSGPWRIAALVCSAGSAAILLGVITAIWGVQMGSDRLARLQDVTLRMRNHILLGTCALVATDRRLLQKFRTVP